MSLAVPTSTRGLATRVLRSSLVQALAAPHGVDRYIELINPLWSFGTDRAVVVAVRAETADATTLTLRPNRWDGFRAGQFIRVTAEVGAVRRTRCYSVTSSEHRHDGLIELTVRAHEQGAVSGFLQRAQPGLVLGLSPAEGEFTLPDERPDRLLLISGGSGITPVMSMLRTLVEEGHDGRVHFLHYTRRADEVIFGAELRSIAARHPTITVTVVPTREPAAALAGHLSLAHLDDVAPDRHDAPTYVCGPEGLIDAATALWDADGATELLHVERFRPKLARRGSAGGTITFARSGTSCANDGRTLLEQAEAAGLRPAHGCRMGICQSCVQRKCDGEIHDARDGTSSAEEDEDIQLCVSVPVGDVTIDL